jgi:tRNA (guanine37-N1)-methyltransferase
MINFHFITLFPDFFNGFISESIIARATKEGKVSFCFHNLRNWGMGSYKQVDDTPYGGGPGMVLKIEPIVSAINEITDKWSKKDSRIILVTPQGKPFKQEKAKEMSSLKNILFICGRYEGFDERVINFVDEEISLGDFILNGGEVAAMAMTEAIFRLVPGVLGKDDSTLFESFQENLLEYPQYTRPEIFDNLSVPSILLSGNHKEIENWRKKESIKKTSKKRPDLFSGEKK